MPVYVFFYLCIYYCYYDTPVGPGMYLIFSSVIQFLIFGTLNALMLYRKSGFISSVSMSTRIHLVTVIELESTMEMTRWYDCCMHCVDLQFLETS